jgi:hypothetical protein
MSEVSNACMIDALADYSEDSLLSMISFLLALELKFSSLVSSLAAFWLASSTSSTFVCLALTFSSLDSVSSVVSRSLEPSLAR